MHVIIRGTDPHGGQAPKKIVGTDPYGELGDRPQCVGTDPDASLKTPTGMTQ